MGSQTVEPPTGEPAAPTPAEEVQSRVAWLLRVSREAGHDTAPDEFAPRLRRHGVAAESGTIAAWETHGLPIDVEVIEAYEAALALPAGGLVRSAQSSTRVLAGTALRPPRVLPFPEVRRELDRLAEVVRHGRPTGADWLSLAQLLTQPDGVVLPGFLEDDWLYLLVDELARAVGPSYLNRAEALARIMDDELHAGRLVALVRERVHEAGAQASADALVIWGTGRDTASVDAAIALLRDPDATIRRGASVALLRRLSTGRLTSAHRDRITTTLRDLLEAGPGGVGAETVALASRVSPDLRGELEAHAPPTLDGRHAAEQILAAIGQACGLDVEREPVLRQLVLEACTDLRPERRPQAAFMIASSPYAAVVARTIAGLLRAPGDPEVARRAARLSVNLAALVDRTALLGALGARDPVLRGYALVALSHGDGVPDDVDLLPHIEDPATAASAVYAAGMSRHPVLEVAAQQPGIDPPTRRALQWWIDRGGRIADEEAE